jgi:GNAT superfamily N-acetyltransferase
MEWVFGDYKISTDKSLLSLERIKYFLSKSYWASDRPIEVIEKSIKNSTCYGIYNNNEQIGLARVVSDYASFYWVCDVFVDEGHRGKGLGKKLIECIVETDDFKDIRGILATRDAHELYKKFGFDNVDSRLYMRRSL